MGGGTANLNANIPNAAAANTAGGPRVVVIFDIRARNLGLIRLGGIDFSLDYTTDTSFGSIDASFAGNYQTTRTNRASPLAPQSDLLLLDEPKLRFVSSLGANIGKFRAQATWYHTGGYKTVPNTTRFQDTVSSFNVFNLFFKYDVPGEGVTEDLISRLTSTTCSTKIRRCSAARHELRFRQRLHPWPAGQVRRQEEVLNQYPWHNEAAGGKPPAVFVRVHDPCAESLDPIAAAMEGISALHARMHSPFDRGVDLSGRSPGQSIF